MPTGIYKRTKEHRKQLDDARILSHIVLRKMEHYSSMGKKSGEVRRAKKKQNELKSFR